MSFFVIQVALPVPLARLFDYLPFSNETKEHYPQGSCVRVKFAGRTLTGVVMATNAKTSVPHKKLKPIIGRFDDTANVNEAAILSAQQLSLGQWMANYYHAPIGEALSLMLPVSLRKGEPLDSACERVWHKKAATCTSRLGTKQTQLWQAFLEQSSWIHKDLTTQGFSLKQLESLKDKGLIDESIELPMPQTAKNKETKTPYSPNAPQQQVIDAINQQQGFHVNLLEGITGSGKTEVYLHCIEHCLSANKKALVLVPEIGLTPQTIRRFQQRFNTGVVMMHSGLNDKQRLIAWRQMREDKASILIGTRSAIFTPIPNLGLIILDEEHDASFKQQEGLRYHARNIALMCAKQANIPVILGSATPSLESLQNAQQGKYQHFKLLQRAGNARLPSLNVQPMFNVVSHNGLADSLLPRIEEHLKAQQQVLIFINRRGFAPILQCEQCGWQADCPQCDARLSLHQNPPMLLCHHCEYKAPIPHQCPSCGNTDIQAQGQGTERIESYLQSVFADTNVKRIDSDNMGKKEAFGNLLDELNQGEPCILIGTQMLAKGHHFPHVTLVIILESDAGLFSSDFRGMELSAQLITQVSGRAGRAQNPGEVWIQSYYPEHPQLLTLLDSGYHALAKELLEQRQQKSLPPYSHMASLRLLSSNPELAKQLGELARQHLQQVQQQHLNEHEQVQILGPFPAIMAKRAGRYRFNLQLMAQKRAQLHKLLESLTHFLRQQTNNHQVQWHLDVDPLETQ